MNRRDRLKRFLIMLPMVAVAVYICFSFIAYSADPWKWLGAGRFIYLVFTLSIAYLLSEFTFYK